jgi:hypothetical protein
MAACDSRFCSRTRKKFGKSIFVAELGKYSVAELARVRENHFVAELARVREKPEVWRLSATAEFGLVRISLFSPDKEPCP